MDPPKSLPVPLAELPWCTRADADPGQSGHEALTITQGVALSTAHPGSELPGGAGEPRGGPTALRMLLGAQLRRLREAAHVSPEDAGYSIRASRSKISRMEHGRVGFKARDVADLLTMYGVTSESDRAGLLELARQANAQGWWAKYGDVLPDW